VTSGCSSVSCTTLNIRRTFPAGSNRRLEISYSGRYAALLPRPLIHNFYV
jgi:hypothetical protein